MEGEATEDEDRESTRARPDGVRGHEGAYVDDGGGAEEDGGDEMGEETRLLEVVAGERRSGEVERSRGRGGDGRGEEGLGWGRT